MSNLNVIVSSLVFFKYICVFSLITFLQSCVRQDNPVTPTNQPPVAPQNLIATTISIDEIHLQWDDVSNNEIGFIIYRSIGSDTLWLIIDTVDANTKFYQDLGLQPRTKYYYKVRSFNEVGVSDFSNVASATTFMLPPSSPQNLIATAVSADEIHLQWDDVSDNEIGFIIYRSMGSNTIWLIIDTVETNVNLYHDLQLQPKTRYLYKVRSFNEGGVSDFSNVAEATTFTLSSWNIISSGTTNNLYDVSFGNVNLGIAIGVNGTILRTVNNGVSWSPVIIGSISQFNSVVFANQTTIFIVGGMQYEDYTKIYKSTNLGLTWDEQNTALICELYDVDFLDSLNLIAVGSSLEMFEGIVLKTTDGGEQWNTLPGVRMRPFGVAYRSSALITIVGVGGNIYQSVDSGNTWRRQISNTTADLYGIDFINENVGIVVGDSGVILKTTNGGRLWTRQTSGTNKTFYAVHFTDDSTCTVVGGEGTILRTTNGGLSWIPQSSSTSNNLRSVYFLDSRVGIVVGDSGIILRTINGGWE